jgi:lysophospholipase L1-like esterase
MRVARISYSLIAIIVCLAGCSGAPTSPSAVAPAVVSGLAPESALTVTPPRAIGVTRFVAFGDSITWGAMSAFDFGVLYAAANGGYPERLEATLNTLHAPQRFSVFNDGQPGELATNALTRFRTMLTVRRPQAVLLLEGINDVSNGITPSATANGLRQMLDAAALSGVPVLLATMYQTYAVVDPAGGLRTNGATAVPELNQLIRQLAAGRPNVFLVDLELVMRDRRLVGADGVHPEDAGFDVMAATFMNAIVNAFPVRGSFQ